MMYLVNKFVKIYVYSKIYIDFINLSSYYSDNYKLNKSIAEKAGYPNVRREI